VVGGTQEGWQRVDREWVAFQLSGLVQDVLHQQWTNFAVFSIATSFLIWHGLLAHIVQYCDFERLSL